MKIKVVPGILEQTREEFEKKILKAKDFSEAVFVDVIDGKFADNETVGMEELNELAGEVEYYVQLMTEEPREYLNECKEAEASLVVGHVELMESQREFVEKGKELEIGVGLGLDLPTPVDFLEFKLFEEIEAVLLMSVKAGESGQEFDEKVLGKIKELRELGFEKDVYVDGGINMLTIGECVKAGANCFSVTSGVWQEGDPEENLKKLLRLAEKELKS